MRSQWGDARVVKRAGNEMKALWIWWNKGPREKKKVLGDPLICIHTALPLCPLPLSPILWDTALFFSLTWDPWPSASNPLITIKSPPPTFLPTQISFFLFPARKRLRVERAGLATAPLLHIGQRKDRMRRGRVPRGQGCSRSRGECCDFLLL